MEERIIDDEYGRGIRLKKTKDGYVDATEETKNDDVEDENEAISKDTEEIVEDSNTEPNENDEDGDEVLFSFPELEEDDEELATLTPEQAEELKRKREEERIKREEEYKKNVEEGQALLLEEKFEESAKKFQSALLEMYDGEEAAIGLCLANTQNFKNPDALSELYENDYEEFSDEICDSAIKALVKDYGDVIKNRIDEIEKEEKPLEEKVVNKQEERRSVLLPRVKRDKIGFFVSLVPSIILLVLTIVFAVLIPTRPDNTFVIATVVSGGVFLIVFLVFMGLSNKLVNTLRINRQNENISYTEEGKELVALREKKEFLSKFFEKE